MLVLVFLLFCFIGVFVLVFYDIKQTARNINSGINSRINSRCSVFSQEPLTALHRKVSSIQSTI